MADSKKIKINDTEIKSDEIDYFKTKVKEKTLDEEKVKKKEIVDSDDKVVAKADIMVEDALQTHKDRLEHYNNNDSYFDGNYWENEDQDFESDVHINKIMPTIRSVVGMLTDKAPEPIVEPSPSNEYEAYEKDRQLALAISTNIKKRWRDIHGQSKLTKAVYMLLIYDDVFVMPYWDDEADDLNMEVLRPHEVMIPPAATSIEDAPYVVIRRYKTRQWFRDNFPDKIDSVDFDTSAERQTSSWWDNVKNLVTPNNRGSTRNIANVAVVDEVWTKDVRVIKAGSTLLEKTINPFWADEYRRRDQGVDNFLSKKKIPIIPINSMNIGDAYSRSIFEQLKTIQRAVDRRKKQIDENAALTANSQIIFDSHVVSQKEVEEKLTNEPGLEIGVPGGEDTLTRLPPDSLPPYVVDDMLHSERVFDDIVGHHDVSRGVAHSSRQTATEAAILRESDVTPVRLLTREIDKALSDLFKFWVHMMKLYYNKAHLIQTVGLDKTMEITENRYKVTNLTSDVIPNDLWVGVQQSSTMAINKRQKKADALQLAQMGLIDPTSLYELLDYPSPDKYTKRLMDWMTGQAGQEEGKELRKMEAQEAMRAQTQSPPPAGQQQQTQGRGRGRR